MANLPCSQRIICPGSDNPLGNFSSEAPDPFDFRAFHFPITNPHNPIGGGHGPIPPVYYAADCGGVCVSFISQEDADLCAARQVYICAHTPPGGTPPTLFSNTLQTCALNCGGGSLFVWQTLPGSFVAISQAAADDQAQAYACQQAALHAFCLNDIPNEAETGTDYEATIFVNGAARVPVTFSVVNGSLPPGLHLTPEGPLSTLLHGTPTTSGTFTFTILARDALNIFVTRTYTITVTGNCGQFWTDIAPTYIFTTLFAASQAFRVGSVITLNAYCRVALDASALAQAQGAVTVPEVNGFSCQITVTPIALVNAINNPSLQLTVQDQVTAAIYLNTGAILPVATTVFNFNLPPGAKPFVSFASAVTNAGNAMDSQVAYQLTVG